MSRRLTRVPALALLALAAAAFSAAAKPPDLPQKLKITVDAAPGVQTMAGFDFICQQAAPGSHPRLAFDPAATRTVLDGLDLLIAAGDDLELARKHAKAGDVAAALALVVKIMTAVPGSRVAEACDEVVADVARCLAKGTPSAPRGREEAAEEGRPECPLMGFLGWLAGGRSACCAAARGKSVMVDGLLKAAHLAMGDGRVEKARELVKQAHALDPERVESDPLVYKMHLLPMTAPAGGEERAALPDHPNQKQKQKSGKKPVSSAAPNIPGLCPDFLDAMEQALRCCPDK